MIDKNFDFASAEPRLYDAWEKNGCFKAQTDPQRENYCIVIPPPNVTGALHIGHALNNTLQDILIRFERLRGKNVLWQAGTDHAGIATQMVVERQMAERGEPSRHAIGRDAFTEKVWAWKEQSGNTITTQLRCLGASIDWERERFTMDEGLSQAVCKVFVQLYKDGLIYRDKRLVNWDPDLCTAISNLEVEQKETHGKMWYFDYPLEAGATYNHPVAFNEEGEATAFEERDFVTVGTTRPETMLGDMVVAVHPDDKRYQDIVGKKIQLPLVHRTILIIADTYADPEQGSGAVKITPAHDFNDFDVGRRAGIEPKDMLNVLTQTAHIISGDDADALHIPKDLQGLERYEARTYVVEAFARAGRLNSVEENCHMVPHGDRSGVVIEPFLTDQWYVDAKKLAGPALEAVESGATRFTPKNWEKTYYQWMHNIEPWCISRQLWWGHQIPIWYGPAGEVICAENEHQAKKDARARGINAEQLQQDEDVLDTWFSSALWPFSTLGWPGEDETIRAFYPTAVLSTAFDIIFFWVARMMMMGLHFMQEVPFRHVYIHALVRDEKGAKMSKSRGNVIDPIAYMETFGTDALRFTLAAMAVQGRDLKLSKERIEGYRNFGTKLWNAARFTQMNDCNYADDFDPARVSLNVNKWIIHEAGQCAQSIQQALQAYRFNDAAGAVYRFVWNIYCDWYLEMAKPALQDDCSAQKQETQETSAWVLDQILIMLHPFMPYITEELWGTLRVRDGFLVQANWPCQQYDAPDAAEEVNTLVALITAIRSVRVEMNVPPGARMPLFLLSGNAHVTTYLERYEAPLLRLARLEKWEKIKTIPKGATQFVVGGGTFALPVADYIDLNTEVTRLQQEIDTLNAQIATIDKKLANENFLRKAPAHVVDAQKTQRSNAAEKSRDVQEALARMQAL